MKLLTWMHWLQDLNWDNGKIWGSGVVPQQDIYMRLLSTQVFLAAQVSGENSSLAHFAGHERAARLLALFLGHPDGKQKTPPLRPGVRAY